MNSSHNQIQQDYLTNKKINIECLIEKLEQINFNEIALILGAGISFDPPACCPLWNYDYLNRVVNSSMNLYGDLYKFEKFIQHRLKNIKPELFFQIMYNNFQENFFGFLDIMLMGKPNFNHYSIAQMALKHHVPFILTTNFDTYIENSLDEFGIQYKLFINNSPSIKKLTKENIYVIHLHGSLDERSSIVLTLRRAGLNLKDDISEFIKYIFSSFTVILVGYSGNDDDIFPVFLHNAKLAKKVYWILWDNENSLTHNISSFAKECHNCYLVMANKENIFEYLLNRHNQNHVNNVQKKSMIDAQNRFLNRWAANIKEEAWQNFLSEIILQIDPTKEEALFISEQSNKIIRGSSDQWLVTKALMNHGIALMLLNEYEKGVDSLLKAAKSYLKWGRHKEMIECITMMISKIPPKWDWGDEDPLFWTSWLSGKTYDPYLLALNNYAWGILSFNDGRIDLAEERLKIAVGFAKKCGDSVNLIHCLEVLSKVFSKKGKTELARQCLAESNKIKKALGFIESAADDKKSNFISDCELAAKKEMHFLLKGEIILFLVFTIFSAIIAWIIVPLFWVRILCVSLGALTWVAVKIWNIKKNLIFPDIVRT